MKTDSSVVRPDVPRRPYHWGGGAQHHRDWDWTVEAGGRPDKDKHHVGKRCEPVWAVKTPLTLGLSYPSRRVPDAGGETKDGCTPAPDTSQRISWALRNQNFRPTCVAQAFVACMELMAVRALPQPTGDGAADGAPIKARQGPIAPRYPVETIYQRMLKFADEEPDSERAPDWREGFTRLRNARQVLEDVQEQYRNEHTSTGGIISNTSEEVLGHTFEVAKYRYFSTPAERIPDLARLVLGQLCSHRPVAIALPAYALNGSTDIPNNWTRPSVLLSGRVEDPLPHETPVPGSGHSVCVVGFLPDCREHLGGYFAFRNSLGEDFAQAPPPTTLARGYGTISATHLQKHCWEFLSLKLKQ